MSSRRIKFNKMVGTVKKLVEAGVMEEPKWLTAVQMRPPIYEIAHDSIKPPPPVVFPEDRFVQSFQDRYPHMQEQAIDLLADEVPPARRFALRQMELMESGIPRLTSRRMVDKELREAGILTPKVDESSAITQTQLTEERQLREAAVHSALSRDEK